jgi:cell division protein ZapB
MEAELKSLETKLAQLIRLAQQLRGENHQLRQEIATAQSANRRLEEKIGGAAQRLEALLQQLPDTAPEFADGHAASTTSEHMT